MSKTLSDIQQELETMGVTEEWAMEHMRISALEEKGKNKAEFQPMAAKYKLYLELTGATPVCNISAFYSTIDKLLDQKIFLLADLLPRGK